MSTLLIKKIAVALAANKHCVLKPAQLPAFWARTPSNLAYRLRRYTGWNIKGRRDKRTGRIHFVRFPTNKTKHNN
jgi:hypothetical protein